LSGEIQYNEIGEIGGGEMLAGKTQKAKNY
jgi:hypothetical protein